MIESISSLCSAFGLSGAAGLNAYIPLLVISIMQNQGKLHLAKNYEFMGEWWFIGILVVLLIIELVVDKIPGADHINDIVHTVVRPTAGAIIFAAEAGNITWIHPGVWMTAGVITSGGIHTVKALARPVVNVGSAGIGAPVVSVVENFVAMVISVVAILLPILAVILMGVFGWMMVKMFRRFFGKREYRGFEPVPVRVTAVPMESVEPPVERSEGKNWGGGV